MAYRWATGVVVGLFDAIFRPSKFVSSETVGDVGGPLMTVRQIFGLTVVYAVNLVLYAGPLTLAGFGVQAGAEPPAWFASSAIARFGDPQGLWPLFGGFFQNSAFLLVASVLTLVTFHAGVVLSLNSKGLVRTTHTVVYSTSAYLAGIFTVVWFLSTNARVTVARDLVLAVQKEFIYFFFDLFGTDLGLPGGRPDPVDVTAMSPTGTWLLATLIVLGLYYLYSLYLGSRINHHTSRFSSLLVVGFVASAPAIYVVGLVLVYTELPVQL